mmetsp:Transcript_36556/g.84313  ORF Transcript_36556/g.84313 Transcript_36556/m.84313 type:complete len:218 (-) Transcript_36556:44-697(-)
MHAAAGRGAGGPGFQELELALKMPANGPQLLDLSLDGWPLLATTRTTPGLLPTICQFLHLLDKLAQGLVVNRQADVFRLLAVELEANRCTSLGDCLLELLVLRAKHLPFLVEGMQLRILGVWLPSGLRLRRLSCWRLLRITFGFLLGGLGQGGKTQLQRGSLVPQLLQLCSDSVFALDFRSSPHFLPLLGKAVNLLHEALEGLILAPELRVGGQSTI